MVRRDSPPCLSEAPVPVPAMRNRGNGFIRYGRPRGTALLRVNAVLLVIPSIAGIHGIFLLGLSFCFIVFPGHPAIRYLRLFWIPSNPPASVGSDTELSNENQIRRGLRQESARKP